MGATRQNGKTFPRLMSDRFATSESRTSPRSVLVRLGSVR